MARTPRLELPQVPLHVVHRGNNRQACFFSDVDRRFYLKCLARSAGEASCAVHAYVLMTNHVHLLVTPHEPRSVSAMMQSLGRRYVRVINTLHDRTGTLWEGRFKSSVVDSERYLLACHRYIELNPVRAGLASQPAAYAWSSHGHYCGNRYDPLITEHAAFRALGADLIERQAAFRNLVCAQLEPDTLIKIRQAIQAGCAVGAEVPQRGRPRKSAEEDGPHAPISRNLF